MPSWKEYKETGRLGQEERLRRLGLLVVDDEDRIVASLAETFAEVFELYPTANSLEGLELFKRHRPALILSDQRMPGRTGIELFSKIKEIDPSTVRILLTGYSDINVVISALNQGLCWKYVTKPWDHDELVSLLRKGARTYLEQAGENAAQFKILGL